MFRNVTVYLGQEKIILPARDGDNIFDLLASANIEIDMPCGGRCFCGKCKMKILGGTKPKPEEKKFLSEDEISQNIRLACGVIVNGDITVYAPLQSKIESAYIKEIRDVSLKSKIRNGYGVAVDVGTTTVAVALVSFKTGKIAYINTLTNEQRAFGSDVVTRIEYAYQDEEKKDELFFKITNQIGTMINEGIKTLQISSDEIKKVFIVGNTCMQLVAFGYDVDGLAKTPFTPHTLDLTEKTASEINLITLSTDTPCFISPGIAPFVGGDTVSCIIASGIVKQNGTNLLVDIGTNGEMAVTYKGDLYCASTAAGPAFEGVHVEKGMGATSGAVYEVDVTSDGTICYKTIDSMPAIGFCGSGIVSMVATLIDIGIIDEMGKFDKDSNAFSKYENSIMYKNDKPAFLLCDNVYITERDIMELQLAKGAIRAGINVLIDETTKSFEEIEKFYIAGGFGSFLRYKDAAKIGLLPKELEKRAITLGNAAITGAIYMLKNDLELKNARKIAKMAKTINLSGNPKFNDEYLDSMMF